MMLQLQGESAGVEAELGNVMTPVWVVLKACCWGAPGCSAEGWRPRARLTHAVVNPGVVSYWSKDKNNFQTVRNSHKRHLQLEIGRKGGQNSSEKREG